MRMREKREIKKLESKVNELLLKQKQMDESIKQMIVTLTPMVMEYNQREDMEFQKMEKTLYG